MSIAAAARVAEVVRAEAERKKISQRRIAEAIGKSQAASWRRLNGHTPFDVVELEQVAKLLGVSAKTLMGRAA